MEYPHHLRPVKMLFTALAKDWIIWGNGYCSKVKFHVYSDFSNCVSIILWGYYLHILGQIFLNSAYVPDKIQLTVELKEYEITK